MSTPFQPWLSTIGTEIPYFTMPLFPHTLRAEIGQHRAPRAAAALITTIARAVRHAHMRGVLHRDLKPDNILIDERGHPHVADFGLAKQVGDATLTAFGIGTPEYAAPEQLRNDRDAITTAVDQYSLGVMLYELLTSERPFRSNGDVLALLRAICETEPQPPRALVRDLPRDLEAICLRSIARTPQERYDTVGAFADDLDRFLRGEPTVARPPGVVGRGRRFLWNHRLAVGLGGSALVLLTVIAGSALNLAHEQERQLSQSTRDGYMHTAQAIASLVTQHVRRQQDQVVALANALAKEDLKGLADDPSNPERLRTLKPHLRNSHKGVTGASESMAPTKATAKPRAAEQLTAAEEELLAHYRRLPPKFQRRLREHAGELETLARAKRGRR